MDTPCFNGSSKGEMEKPSAIQSGAYSKAHSPCGVRTIAPTSRPRHLTMTLSVVFIYSLFPRFLFGAESLTTSARELYFFRVKSWENSSRQSNAIATLNKAEKEISPVVSNRR